MHEPDSKAAPGSKRGGGFHQPVSWPRSCLLSGLVAAFGLASALPAHGDDIREGQVEVGIGHVSDSEWRFGRHSGLHEDGLYPLLGLDWFFRKPWDAENPDYARVTVTDAGIPLRRGKAVYGRQGQWQLRAGYRQLPWRIDDTGRTPYQPAGAADQTLPRDWQAAPGTEGMNLLLPSLGPADQRQRRRQAGVGGTLHLPENWTLSSDFREERRDGTRAMGATLGTTGGNARSVLLAAPVDYRTREAEVTAGFSDARRQLEITYLASIFDNRHPGLAWDSPFQDVSGWNSAAFHPTGRGQLGLPPDNRFHQIRSSGGIRLTDRHRLVVQAAFGRMTQDDDFLPYTINPGLEVSTPLPRSSLDGRIDTTVLDMRLVSNPMGSLQVTTRYRLDDRDNRTPRDEYVQLRGDAENQATDSATNRRRFNRPYDYTEHRAGLDARYRLGARSRLTGTLEHRQVDRSFSEREKVRENRIQLGLNRGLGDSIQVGLRGEVNNRTGSTYDGAADLADGFAPEYAETVTGGWINVPGLRQFHLADRRRHRLGASLQGQWTDAWSTGLEVFRQRDRYRESEIGLTESAGHGSVATLAWMPDSPWTANLYAGREWMKARQAGHSVRGGPNRLPDLANPERRWFVDQADRIDSAGLGLRREWLDGRLAIQGDLSHTRTRAGVEVRAGQDLEVEPLPLNRTRSTHLILRGEYRIGPALDLVVRYWTERFDSRDWAIDDASVDQLSGVIGLGETSPDYRVHVISTALSYRFH